MHSPIFCALCAISHLLFLCLSQPLFSQNIVANGDFETWPVTTDWTTIGTGIAVTQEIATLHGGASSARVAVNTDDQTLTDFRQSVNVTAGVMYDLSVWVFQTDNQTRTRIYCNGFIGVYSDENLAGQWQELVFTFTAAATGPIEVGLRFYDVAGNWIAAPSVMYIDDYSVSPQAGVTASQFAFLYPVPANAGTGLPFELTICATDGVNTAPGYVNPIGLIDNGSTATHTLFPASPAAPATGCVTYQITPTSTGDISLQLGNADFPNLLTGIIPVATYSIPTISISAEVPDTDPNGSLNADALNDAWESTMGSPCAISYETVYGSLSYDNATHTGTISGMVQVIAGPASAPYAGAATFRLVNMDGPPKGTHFTNGNGTLSAAATLQANAPKPAAVAGDLHFTENTGNLTAKNALLFSFSQAIPDFGLWVGDVETNPFGTEAEVVLFNGDAELTRASIPTTSTVAEQMNTGGTGCGSSTAFAGCGNHSTVWISFTGGDVTDMLIIVGDDDVSGAGLTEHLSFAGPTTGGNCNEVVLAATGIQLQGEVMDGTTRLHWSSGIGQVFERFEIQSSGDGHAFSPVGEVAGNIFAFVSAQWLADTAFFRIKGTGYGGESVFSNRITLSRNAARSGLVSVYPNPAGDVLHLVYESVQSEVITLMIFNAQGQQVQVSHLEVQPGVNDLILQVMELAGSMYSFRMLGKEFQTSGRFIKQ